MSGEYLIPLSSSNASISSCAAPSYRNNSDVAYNLYCGIVLTIASTLELAESNPAMHEWGIRVTGEYQVGSVC